MSILSVVPLTTVQRNISIAEIAIFAIPLLIRILWIIRTKLPLHDVKPSAYIALFFRDGIFMFCSVRLVGGALYVAADSPKDSILTGALILESLGSQLLLVQLTKLLVGYLDRSGPKSHRIFRYVIQGLRLPVFAAIILFIAGYNVDSTSTYEALVEAGSILIFLAFWSIVACYMYFFVACRASIDVGVPSFSLAILALPFLFIRLLYQVLGCFRVDGLKFVIIFGRWEIFVGMSLLMEILVVALLLASEILEVPMVTTDEPDSVTEAQSKV